MNRAEALAHFEQTYVKPKTIEKMKQVLEFMMLHRDELAAQFEESLRQICSQIKAMQFRGELNKIGYIQYAMLRSAILEKQPVYRIDVYNKKWFFDLEQRECQSRYDASALFGFLDQLEKELDELRRPYLNQITQVDLEKIKLREASRFNQYIVYLGEYALLKAHTLNELATIAKEDEFEIRVGEYYDFSEIVYKEDCRNKVDAEMKEWLEERHENQYVAAVLKNLDLSGGSYHELNLRRVNFSGSNLLNSQFAKCTLTKARFNNCRLQNANFSEAFIYDADFSGADLKQAIFKGAEGVKGTVATLYEGFDSLLGVNFAGADLEGADFRFASLSGANFKDANVKNAMFNRVALKEIDFDVRQREVILWVD